MTNKTPTDVLATIVAGIAATDVSSRVVGVFVERELTKRTDLLVKGFDKLATLNSDLNKVNRGDIEHFADGNPETKPTLTFSKARREEIKKAKEAIEKLEKAMTKALSDKADFNDLQNLVK